MSLAAPPTEVFAAAVTLRVATEPGCPEQGGLIRDWQKPALL
jgi:hypothetical protein